jgi:hypothetical protein
MTIPCIGFYAIIMAKVKYEEGYVDLRTLGYGVIPKPHQLWSKANQAWILPSVLTFAVGWSFEITSHLEELAFWLFLLHQGPNQRHWFSSLEFRGWVLGSLIALAGLPTLTVLLRDDVDTQEAWLYFSGSTGSLLVTLWFLIVLWKFPAFLRRVRSEGADPEVVVRLATFNELNRIRIAFRFIFNLSLLTLSIDGILPGKKHVNENLFASDLLAMLGGLGTITSSVLTLLIFFPRSVAKEAGYKAKTISIRSGVQHTVLDSPTSTTWGATANQDYDTPASVPSPYGRNAQPEALSPQQHRILLNQSMPMRPLAPGHGGVGSGPAAWDEDKHPGDIEAGIHDPDAYIKMESRPYLGDDKPGGPTVKLGVPKRPQRPGTQVLNPLILSYTSPIDLIDSYAAAPRPRPSPTHF